ncbi:MAG: hypothetical protein ACTSYQ_03730 [Candidatus Odinarchaeia archaeon]
MNKKIPITVSTIIIASTIIGGAFWYLNYQQHTILPLGEDPQLILPLYDFSHLDGIGRYGQITEDFYHNGIDFSVNQSTIFVAPHDCYVKDIIFAYNELGGHWQTNVLLTINQQWTLELIFESWAENETYGQLQRDQIIVNQGDFIEANQTIGTLLIHGKGAHVHFTVRSYDTDVCPYQYFTPEAKATFEELFYEFNPGGEICA